MLQIWKTIQAKSWYKISELCQVEYDLFFFPQDEKICKLLFYFWQHLYFCKDFHSNQNKNWFLPPKLIVVMGRVPENPKTRPEGFLLARTRPEPEKVQTRPENPKKPEILEK